MCSRIGSINIGYIGFNIKRRNDIKRVLFSFTIILSVKNISVD